ncbi:uncharacterized protein LOC110840176 isoform X1 [Zootermopsis nevadensis]|uniref:Uncharacterized protein n=1 Tax=Zootermopsis nevadensis TaxID=136037 RepID=A0A067QGK8_ZOONE|nr:uncharacterized protein LOC110840176 isoform X1 [Zootermopsis nevadensis]XP_021940711.1 uncharacterized protein LOC110840176 isoform X1 [Zootermopsis nevadensis]KDR07396.1 hypothetical protein L798_03126 [Zootermopsis nevadensis]
MPSFDHSFLLDRPVLICNKAPVNNNLREDFKYSAGITNSGKMTPSLTAVNNKNPAANNMNSQADDISNLNSIDIVSHDNARIDKDGSNSVLLGKRIPENVHSENCSKNMESRGAYSGLLEYTGNNISCSSTVNQHMNLSLPTHCEESSTYWLLTDFLLLNSSVASENSSGSDSVANSMTVEKDKCYYALVKSDKLVPLQSSCSNSDMYTSVNEEKLLAGEQDVNINTLYKSYMNNMVPKSTSEQHIFIRDAATINYEIFSVPGKYLNEETECEMISPQTKRMKIDRDSSIEEGTLYRYKNRQDKTLREEGSVPAYG